MLTNEERAAFFKMLADYKRIWITTSEVLKAVESIVRAARAQELRDAADEARMHAVSCPEPEHCNDRRLCAVHNETTADWLWDRANHIESSQDG